MNKPIFFIGIALILFGAVLFINPLINPLSITCPIPTSTYPTFACKTFYNTNGVFILSTYPSSNTITNQQAINSYMIVQTSSLMKNASIIVSSPTGIQNLQITYTYSYQAQINAYVYTINGTFLIPTPTNGTKYIFTFTFTNQQGQTNNTKGVLTYIVNSNPISSGSTGGNPSSSNTNNIFNNIYTPLLGVFIIIIGFAIIVNSTRKTYE